MKLEATIQVKNKIFIDDVFGEIHSTCPGVWVTELGFRINPPITLILPGNRSKPNLLALAKSKIVAKCDELLKLEKLALNHLREFSYSNTEKAEWEFNPVKIQCMKFEKLRLIAVNFFSFPKTNYYSLDFEPYNIVGECWSVYFSNGKVIAHELH